MKKIILILIILLSISCKQTEKNKDFEKIELNEKFKLDFLSQILSDSTDYKLLKKPNRFISNYFDLSPQFENDSLKISHSEYISQVLEINDIDFIKGQIEQNESFDYDKLGDYGFNILDAKGLIEKGITYTKILEYTEKKENYGFLIISVPIFNKDLNRAYIRLYDFGGETIIFEKINGKWEITNRIDQYAN